MQVSLISQENSKSWGEKPSEHAESDYLPADGLCLRADKSLIQA